MPGHNAPHHEGDILTRPACIRRCSPLSWRGCWCNPAFVRWIASWRPQAQHMETSIIARAFNNLKDTVPLRISGSQMIPFSRIVNGSNQTLKFFPVHHIFSHLITSTSPIISHHLPSSPWLPLSRGASDASHHQIRRRHHRVLQAPPLRRLRLRGRRHSAVASVGRRMGGLTLRGVLEM